MRFLTRIEPTDHHNIILANLLLRLHKPHMYEINCADYFYQRNKKAQSPYITFNAIYHPIDTKLNRKTFGLASKIRWK